MKKILATVDALHFSEQELKSYKYIADKARGALTILFLENIAGEALQFTAPETGVLDYDTIFAESKKERKEKSLRNKKRLQEFCQDSGMDVTIREIPGVPAAEALEESRFADLLLVRSNTTFSVIKDSNPTRFVKDLLVEAQCPVMVVPETTHFIREIMFSYNGTFSSMFAIRQFTDLFGDTLSEVPVKVVYITEGDEKKIPFGKLVKEYLNHHYEEITYHSLEGKPAAELLGLTLQNTNGIITLGAYGRSRTSRFFHHSDADAILRTANIPIFITHP